MESRVGSANVAFFHYSICLYDCTLLETAGHRLSRAVGTLCSAHCFPQHSQWFYGSVLRQFLAIRVLVSFLEKILGQSRDLLVHFPFCSLHFSIDPNTQLIFARLSKLFLLWLGGSTILNEG